MKKFFFTISLLAFFLSSCGAAPAQPTAVFTDTPIPPTPTDIILPTVTPACGSSQPSQDDVARLLSYADEVFSGTEWEESSFVADTFAAATYQDVTRGALAYFEARIKPCGYEEPDLNKEFNDEAWQAIFAYYETYEMMTQCRTDGGLRLYQFTAQNQGMEYYVNYWVENDTDRRIITAMLVFPMEEIALFGDFSARLFPRLPNCS